MQPEPQEDLRFHHAPAAHAGHGAAVRKGPQGGLLKDEEAEEEGEEADGQEVVRKDQRNR